MPNNLTTSFQTDERNPDTLHLKLQGRLDSTTAAQVWRDALNFLDRRSPREIILDASDTDYCDMSGISLMLALQRHQKQIKGSLEIRGLKPEFQKLLDMFDPAEFDPAEVLPPKRKRFPEEVGRGVVQLWEDIRELIVFVGELCVALVLAFRNPGQVRWKDVFLVAEITGVNALPIVLLVSFLIGLIMSFQAAIPMRMFGAEIYVADLIALSMTRELGPIMTAIVLAGRSASAFAAELGTMKVNEEIDALSTMGLDPLRFLVVPRVIAAVVMTPLLTVFAIFLGIIGGAVVLLSLGFPLIAYVNQVLSAITYVDFLGGIVKCFVFGVLIAGIGCLRGLQTQTGPSAVGDSTTRAVVSGIILIVVTDGIFSVAYFYLGV